MNLYLTADSIGTPTGGGVVTKHEQLALDHYTDRGMVEDLIHPGGVKVLSRRELGQQADPWGWDEEAYRRIALTRDGFARYKLAHVYSGSFSWTVRTLRCAGCKVAYTIAAHDREISRREHEQLGLGFPYPHLTDPQVWERYIGGYRDASVIVCPGRVPATTVRNYGPDFASKRIEIIPHGCDLPVSIASPPARFTVGYLGAVGPDKGLRYLLEAWKLLNYKDATLLIGGRESTSPLATTLISHFGGGDIQTTGWVDNISDFYNQCSVYVQPSATEGFGIEVLESMAHGRPALCSDAAGAADVVPEGCVFKARDAKALAEKIEEAMGAENLAEFGLICRQLASHLTWDKIRQKYITLWESMR